MIGKKTIFIAHNWSLDTVSSMSYYLALELSKEHNVVFLNSKGARKKYEKINDNLEVYDWPNKRPTTLKDFIFLLRLIVKYKPNVVVAHFGAVNVSMLCAKLMRVKHRYCYYHTLTYQIDFDRGGKKFGSINNKLERWRKKFIYKASTKVIAGTNFAKKDLEEHFDVKPEKITTVYHGIPDTNFRNNAVTTSIGFLGRLDVSKGVDILITAVGKLINDNVDISLEIAGRGIEQQQLEEVINVNGWQERIQFVGFLPYSRVHKFICDHYIMVLPSRIDNPSIVLLEAFCTQTPIIAAAAGAIPEIIEHNRTGLLFKSEDSIDLSEKILTLINNKALRNELALAGRKKFEERFTIDKNVEEAKKLVLHG